MTTTTDRAPMPGSYTPPTPEKPVATPLPRWKRLLFGGILFAIVLGALELVSVVFLKVTRGYDGEHLWEFEFDPYKNILPARGFVDTRGVRHNSVGFRGSREFSVQKAPGTYRVILMGASVAYGTGGLWPHIQREFAVIPDSQTIDAYLERELQRAMPGVKVEVINAAIVSTWTHHHLIYLNQRILAYDPDMVLFLDGYNDFYQASPDHDQFGSYIYNTQATGILGEPTIGALVRANGWWLYRKSAFAFLSIRAMRNLKLLVTTPDPGERQPMDVERSVANLQQVFPRNALKMHRRAGLILRDEGVIPVFMLQPMLILERDKPMPEIERRLFDFNVESYLANYEQFIGRAVEFVRAEETKMASDVGGHFIDLTGIYRAEPQQIYTDYAHLTPAGNRILAENVAQRLVPLIGADVASRCEAGTGAACR